MNSDQLLQFKAIAEEGNMHRAAEKLYISQPALSKTLNKLENELNCELFYRTPKGLLLSKNGALLLKYANKIAALIDDVQNKILSDEAGEKLTVYSEQSTFFGMIIGKESIENCKNYILKEVYDDSIWDSLMSKEADAIIAHAGSKTDEELLNKKIIYKNQIYLSIPNGHPLSSFDYIFLNDLNNMHLANCTFNASPWVNDVLKKRKINVIYDYNLDKVTFASVRDTIELPYLTTSSSMSMNRTTAKYRKLAVIKDKEAQSDVYLWWLKSNEAKVKKIIDNMYRFFKNE